MKLHPALAALPHGRLAENVLHFVRVLRATGIPVGPAKVIDALAAVEAVGIGDRGDFRAALAAVLVSRHEWAAAREQLDLLAALQPTDVLDPEYQRQARRLSLQVDGKLRR